MCDDERHFCKKRCYQECGPCPYPVEHSLACGHAVTLPCHRDVSQYECVVPVATVLPCGHGADKPCARDPETFRCPMPCDLRVEPCGHACSRSCHVRDDPDHLEVISWTAVNMFIHNKDSLKPSLLGG